MSRSAVTMVAVAALLATATWRLANPPASGDSLTRKLGGASSSAPPVRVLLGEPRPSVSLRVEGPYRVMARGDWRVLAQGARLAAVEVRADATSLRLGDREFTSREVDVQALQPGTLWIDGRRYSGHARLVRHGVDRVAVVNVVALEDYVAGVVDAEMPASFPAEARAAQAIAARTFALAQMKTVGGTGEFDLGDGTSSQVYRGLGDGATSGEVDSAASIAERTRGVVLTYQGRLFASYYGAACGGSTVDGHRVFARAAPPLVSVACEHCRDAPRYRWDAKLPRDELAARATPWCAERGRPLGELENIEVLPAEGGSPAVVRLVGSEGTCELSAHEFRQQLAGVEALPSADFAVEPIADGWIAHGRGWGHRVGMCQWGARRLATDGRTCEEILAYYYPGAELMAVR